MSVTRLSITPIKGMQLQDRTSIELSRNGVADDRRFYVIDERGLMFNGKKEGRLVAIEVVYDPQTERLALRFPDRTEVAGIWSAGEAVTTNFYGRPVRGHLAVGPWSDALSTFTGRSVRLVAVDRLGDAVDVHPLTLVSQASIDRLRSSAPGAEQLDYRRFRMLVELDELAANAEDGWAGQRVRIGSALVEVVGPVPRCVVTTQNPDSGASDFPTLKAIVAYRGAFVKDVLTPTAHLPDGGKVIFGVYGTVIEAGRISLGDAVTVVSPHSSGA